MVALSTYMIVFRFLHIIGGSFWFGAALLFGAFLGPAAGDVGPSAGPLLANMVVKRHVAKVISGASMLTVTAGLFVYCTTGRRPARSAIGSGLGSGSG